VQVSSDLQGQKKMRCPRWELGINACEYCHTCSPWRAMHYWTSQLWSFWVWEGRCRWRSESFLQPLHRSNSREYRYTLEVAIFV